MGSKGRRHGDEAHWCSVPTGLTARPIDPEENIE